MNSGIKLRLATLGLAIGLMGALIALIILNSERQAEELRTRLEQLDLESFRIADRFRDKLRYANDQMRHYASARETAIWDEFLKASQELKVWIQTQAPALTAEGERAVLNQMDSAYSVYLQKAQDLHARMETSGESSASLAEYNSFLEQSRRFLDLGQELSRTHYASRNQILAHAQRTLTQLRLSVLGVVGLLFLFGAALATGIYRHLIAPLRVKLVQSQALIERHEKLASLGMLAAGVAHEIRNPLTAIKAALFIQQKKFQPGSPEYADAKLVEREILRLERIVNDFLQFARPTEPEFTVVSADLLLMDVHQFFSPQLAKSNIQLTLEAPAPQQIRVDAAQIKQVLINLVRNAADSIGRDGTITLGARHDRKRLSNGEADVVILEVRDTGKGISPEVEKRLFDPFFTTKDNGTGLGLSIAARIVEKHGGVLLYQTQMNRGTTFGIVLPQATL